MWHQLLLGVLSATLAGLVVFHFWKQARPAPEPPLSPRKQRERTLANEYLRLRRENPAAAEQFMNEAARRVVAENQAEIAELERQAVDSEESAARLVATLSEELADANAMLADVRLHLREEPHFARAEKNMLADIERITQRLAAASELLSGHRRADFCRMVSTAFAPFATKHEFVLEVCEEHDSFDNAEAIYRSPDYVLRVYRERSQHFLALRPLTSPILDIDLADLLILAGRTDEADRVAADRAMPYMEMATLLTAHFERIHHRTNPAAWVENAPVFVRFRTERADQSLGRPT